MTVAVAVRSNDNVIWLAADSQIYDPNDGTIEQGPAPKLFYGRQLDGPRFLMASSGDVRFANILQYVWEPPEISMLMGHEVVGWFMRTVVPSLIHAVEEAGYLQVKDGRKHMEDNDLLVAFANYLFYIDDAFGVIPVTPKNRFYAIGSGRRYALGALHALAPLGLTAQEMVIRAVKAASHYSPTCGGPIGYAAANDYSQQITMAN